jgi:hypothetical protein
MTIRPSSNDVYLNEGFDQLLTENFVEKKFLRNQSSNYFKMVTKNQSVSPISQMYLRVSHRGANEAQDCRFP